MDLPERGDVPAGFDPELIFTINHTKKATLRRVAFLLLALNLGWLRRQNTVPVHRWL